MQELLMKILTNKTPLAALTLSVMDFFQKDFPF